MSGTTNTYKKLVLILIPLLVLASLLYLAKVNQYNRLKLANQLREVDTVYINKPYVVSQTTSYKVQQPQKVLVYLSFSDTVRIKETLISPSSLTVNLNNGVGYTYHSNFFSPSFISNPRLVELSLNDKNLSLALLNPDDGKVYNSLYHVNTHLNKYHWDNTNGFTSKKFLLNRVDSFVSVSYLPIQSMANLGLSLKYNTSLINYEVGLNTNLCFQKSINLNLVPYFKLEYQLF